QLAMPVGGRDAQKDQRRAEADPVEGRVAGDCQRHRPEDGRRLKRTAKTGPAADPSPPTLLASVLVNQCRPEGDGVRPGPGGQEGASRRRPPAAAAREIERERGRGKEGSLRVTGGEI